MTPETKAQGGHGKQYTYVLDGIERQTARESLTAAELMDEAGVPRSAGLVEITEDGTERTVPLDETIVFEGPGRRFKKAPRFKRG